MLRNFFRRKNKKSFSDRQWLWLLGGILLLAAALRLINISAEPYWPDEILSLDIYTTSSSLSEMVRYLYDVEFHPPLYYILMWFWTALFGAGELATRLLSLLFSLGAIVLVYVAGQRMFASRQVGLIAAFVLAVLPIQIEFGQEARPYALMVCAGIGASILLWEYLKRPRLALLLAYSLVTLAGVYLHYSYIFVAAATSGWWLLDVFRQKRGMRWTWFVQWLMAHGIIFIVFWPWMTALLHKFFVAEHDLYGLSRNTTQFREPALVELLFNQLFWTTKYALKHQIEIIAEFVFKGLLLLSMMIFFRTVRGRKKTRDAQAYLYLLWLVCVPLMLFVLSPQSAIYSEIFCRHVLFITVPLVLLLASVSVVIPKKWGAVLLAVFIITLVPAISRVTMNDAVWDHFYRYEETGQFINEHYQPGDIVIVPVSGVRTDVAHFLRPEIEVVSLLPIDYYGQDVWRSRSRLGLIENELQFRVRQANSTEIDLKLRRLIKLHGTQRIWLSQFHLAENIVHAWFHQNGWRHVYWNVGNVLRLDLYERR